MKPRHKRFILIAGVFCLFAVAVALVLSAFKENLVFFHTPSDVVAGTVPEGRTFRIGGIVEAGSIQRGEDGLTVRFAITDTAKAVPVAYKGSLPDLFKEGQGAVVQGKLGADGLFHASEVLAKHDENYMPPEADHAVKQAQKAAETLVLP